MSQEILTTDTRTSFIERCYWNLASKKVLVFSKASDVADPEKRPNQIITLDTANQMLQELELAE